MAGTKMTAKTFCETCYLELFDCGPGWGGRIGYRIIGSRYSVCGFKTANAAYKAFIKEQCGAAAPTVLKLLGMRP